MRFPPLGLLVVLVAFSLAARPPASRPISSFSIETGCAKARVHYSPDVMSRDRLKKLVRLWERNANYLGQPVPQLELCPRADPAYRPCGDRTIASPNFLYNAQVNIHAGERQVREFEETAAIAPAELNPVLTYTRSALTFWVALERARFDFLTAWSLDVLTRDVAGVSPASKCAAALDAIARASSMEEKYRLTTHDWHNCVNAEFVRGLGQYPEAAWRRFIENYSIRIDEDGCDD